MLLGVSVAQFATTVINLRLSRYRIYIKTSYCIELLEQARQNQLHLHSKGNYTGQKDLQYKQCDKTGHLCRQYCMVKSAKAGKRVDFV